ncbi:hypothetical protein D9756_002509 [Leucocoprinus leucothites]|uniref:Uncharacterized protein n=1 Tax=Leucocoprinus leucothites TaxID=201217 RepID=A0A8H5GCC5_9AGAR|nr:hypothetical protein D9756_002509 [Leucoagaricus leucothites]
MGGIAYATVRSSAPAGKVSPTPIAKRKRLTSRGHDVGIRFPIGEVHHHLRQRSKSKYLITNDAADLVNSAAVVIHTLKKVSITPRAIFLAVVQDKELEMLLGHVTIRDGGVEPFANSIDSSD